MKTKKYKYKNKIIGYIESSWDDYVGTMRYTVYHKLSNGHEDFLFESDIESESVDFAEGYFTTFINYCKESEKKARLINKLNKKWEAKYRSLLNIFTDNNTKPLSDFDRDQIDRIMEEYAFKIGLNSF